ncbi:hypothetical protein E4U11_001738 [Claviceps purpurea]|nr:hypothetical protein E4U11_001738 [Claviceps purpurea]
MDLHQRQPCGLRRKRLAHYFESGEAPDWNANAFLAYLETLCADNTTIAVARLELHQLRQRAAEPSTEFLVRFEAQLAKADRLGIDDRDKIGLPQMALHTGFDKRCRTTTLPLLTLDCSTHSRPVNHNKDGDEDDHLSRVNIVLGRMLPAGLNIDLAKYAFNVKHIC